MVARLPNPEPGTRTVVTGRTEIAANCRCHPVDTGALRVGNRHSVLVPLPVPRPYDPRTSAHGSPDYRVQHSSGGADTYRRSVREIPGRSSHVSGTPASYELAHSQEHHPDLGDALRLVAPAPVRTVRGAQERPCRPR